MNKNKGKTSKSAEKREKNLQNLQNNNKIIEKKPSSFLTNLKIKTSKFGTNISLAILSKANKVYKTNIIADIPYSKLDENKKPINDKQTLNIHIPNCVDLCPVIFYIHGGAWSSGDKAYYSEYCQKLCEQGFVVVNINYRLLPDCKLYDIVCDCKKAIKFALNRARQYKIDKSNIFMIGDSAGAHLCALISGEWTKKNIKFSKNIRALGLYYGAYDLTAFDNSNFGIVRTMADYFKIMLHNNTQKYFLKYSPVQYVTEHFPDTLLICGKRDKLFEQSENFVNILDKNQVKYQLLFFPKTSKDAMHGFLNFINSQSSTKAFNTVIEFFKSRIIDKNIKK